jgi:multidrug efflux system outer membrane protein
MLLAGCTTLGPDYKRPEVELPKVWRVDPANAADTVNTDWWQAFGDAELDRLIETALESNKDLLIATQRIEQSMAQLQISNSANYPQITYNGSAERQRRSQERPNGLAPGVSASLSNYELSTNLAWELDLWGKVRRANEAARAELLSTQEGRHAVMLTVVATLANTYVQLVELDHRLLVARLVVKNRQDLVVLLDQKYRGGSTTLLAVEQARVEVELNRAEIPPVERQIATLENAVSILLGRNPGPVARRKLDQLKLLQLPQGVPAHVLERRPDVMAAEQDLVAANARIGVARTQYFPTISLNAILGLAADTPRWLWAETARDGNYGAGLTGPIFNGGRIEGNIKEAEATQRLMAVRFEQVVQTALRETEDALVSRTKSGEREDALGRQLAALQEVARLSKLRYEGGQSTLTDVLEADRKVFIAQSQLAESRRDTLQALVAVYKAMGGGWMMKRDKQTDPPPPEPEVHVRKTLDDEAGR